MRIHSPSPWLAQLQHERPHFSLEHNTDTDIVVVGAGIAGVATAYNLLKFTQANILLVDAGRIAHGATGRNAGQVVSYFERPLADIVRGYGLEIAVQGQIAIESSWGYLEDIIRSCNLQTPLYRCQGYAGFTGIEQIVTELEEKDVRQQAGIFDDPLLVCADPALRSEIPKHLGKYVMEVPHSTILRALETENTSYIAAETSPKGCMNSALFCEELVGWMLQMHGHRLTVAERLPVSKVTLEENKATLKTRGPTITARRVVLCTNGFENFDIENLHGPEIDVAFHHSVQGCIGYMAGYIDEPDQPATAVSYHAGKGDIYHYLTRRPFQGPKDERHSLVCIGGPERMLPDRATYDPTTDFPGDIEEELDRELRTTYHDLPPIASRMFLWQGLMCYTPNRIRRIGFEQNNPALLYNLGCNGVGILPSIYGGRRIAHLLAGLHLGPSIFDPEKGNL